MPDVSAFVDEVANELATWPGIRIGMICGSCDARRSSRGRDLRLGARSVASVLAGFG